ncbi:VOC family protein [Amycolatopsis ultiminotia]|uniref:VOC family protein n=1 Tax=Amycolatopsis ultiminotia TaxID=543629 RepID=A0ABP6WGJ2_9PSEU
MPAPKLAHVVFRTSQGKAMSDWYCDVLDGHVVYGDEGLTFITFDDEHHRVALLHPPIETVPQPPATASMHHTAYTFDNIDDLLDRYTTLKAKKIEPAVCIAHGVTTSMYYRDPDGHFVEMQIDNFATPDEATAYMNEPEYAGDSVGPAFDPKKLLEERQAGVPLEKLTDRSWAIAQGLPDPLDVLLG